MNINNIPPNYANVVAATASVAPVERPVGFESREGKRSAFKPVSQSERSSEVKDKASSEYDDQRLQAERAQISELAARDREVRVHEQAHKSAGGSLAGSASFEYQRGPDGRRYAVAGEVPIKLPSSADDPQRQIVQAQRVQRAALAPAEPSQQDRQVAMRASQIEQKALAILASQQLAEGDAALSEKPRINEKA